MARSRSNLFAAPAIALFLGAMGCGRGCTCISGEKSYERLDGKVKVELVRKTHWAGGKIPGPVSAFVIRVHTDPLFEEQAPCEKVELAEDDAGKNVAFRCDGTHEWTVLRLRGKDRRILECHPPVGTSKKPRFEALAKIQDITGPLLDCLEEESEGFRRFRATELVTSMREEAGPPATIALVTGSVSRAGAFALASPYDPWDAMLGALSLSERTTVLATVCEGLLHAETPSVAYLHALRWCSLDNVQGIGEVALTRLQKMVREGHDKLGGVELQWVAALASRAKPTEAAEAACASGRNLSSADSAALMALIARAHLRCAAVTAALAPAPCSADLDCDGGLCTEAELKTQIDAWVAGAEAQERDDAGARDLQLRHYDPLRAILAAAYAQGPLPRDIVVTNGRRQYPLSEDAGPDCEDGELAENALCTCRLHGKGSLLCTVPADKKVLSYGACDIRIDDAKRRLEAHHVCGHEQKPCHSSAPCCPGLTCLRHDGGELHCEHAPADSGDR